MLKSINTSDSRQQIRDDIINDYRDRIAQNMRSKLSKHERFILADSFIDLLGYCQSEEDCRILCEAEIALLEEGYPQASIANQYLPEWRKAIASAVEEGRLPRMELKPNEYGKKYEHWALYHLIYSNEVYRALKRKTTAKNNKKQDDLQPVRADRFISTARTLLEKDNPLEQAAGLLALTGRRFSEIVTFGEFWQTEHPYAIAFKGQLKKGLLDVRDAETFLIATLVESKGVIEALERFRKDHRIVELQNLDPDEINSRLNTSVRHHIKREFQDNGLVPILKGEKSVSAHNLRGVYGTIAIRFFCPAQQNPHRFVQAHLGHIIGKRELASRKNAGASEHYFHYYLVGAQNQMLGERGILLEQVGELPTTIKLPDEPIPHQSMDLDVAIAADEPNETPVEDEPMTTKKTTKAKKGKTQKRSRTSVPADLMDKLKAIASVKFDMRATATNAEVMEGAIAFLGDDNTPQMAQSIDNLGNTMQWFTSEMDRLRGVIEGLEQEVVTAQSERDQAADELDRIREQGQGEGDEVEALREENATLRNELQQFHQLKQLLGGGNSTIQTSPIAAATTTPIPAPIASVQPPKNKRVQNEETAIASIDRAISLIMVWNDEDERTINEKWFISTPALQEFGKPPRKDWSWKVREKDPKQRYAHLTNYIYRELFGMDASQMKAIWQNPVSGSRKITRNYIPEKKGLEAIAYCEQLISQLNLDDIEQAHDITIQATRVKFKQFFSEA